VPVEVAGNMEHNMVYDYVLYPDEYDSISTGYMIE
jgi:hypothetical protein